MKRDDTLWKAILEDVFDDFLLFFFEEEAAMFDFEKGFEFLDKELEQLFPSGDHDTGTRFVDKLVKVFTKNGGEQWVLVHVEVQGYSDSEFGKRMFTYFSRILDHYNKPVTCIAIFTDGNKNFKPAGYEYSFLGTKNNFSYNTYKVIDQQESELRKSKNPFALVILTVLIALKKGKITDEKLMGLKTGLLKALLKSEFPKTKIQSLVAFLRLYVRFDNPENTIKFDNEINLITNKYNTMGIVEFVLERAKNEGVEIGVGIGMEKGMEKGMEIKEMEKNLAFVKSLLTQTTFSVKKIARMADVTIAFVKEVKASLTQSPN